MPYMNAWREVSKVIHLIFGYLTFLGGDRISMMFDAYGKELLLELLSSIWKKMFNLGSRVSRKPNTKLVTY